jgi:hypothetical protein
MNANQLTGNIALYHAAWQLSRLGWNVMPTIRNAKGSDLILTKPDESEVRFVQVKGVKGKGNIFLKPNLDDLQSDWWVIVSHAETADPVGYILRLAEVKSGATQSHGQVPMWHLVHMMPKYPGKGYALEEYRHAWHRLDQA